LITELFETRQISPVGKYAAKTSIFFLYKRLSVIIDSDKDFFVVIRYLSNFTAYFKSKKNDKGKK